MYSEREQSECSTAVTPCLVEARRKGALAFGHAHPRWPQEESVEAWIFSICRLEEISTAVCQAAYKPAVEFQSSKLSALPFSNLYFTDSNWVLLKLILLQTLWLGPSLVDQFALKLSSVWVTCSTASFLDISDMYPRHLLFIFNPFTKMGSWWPPATNQQEQLWLARLLIKLSTSSSNFPGSSLSLPGHM